ncbi:MAG: hypothetical protein J6M34_06670 [Clostridia bacterium]|nr:hypothetical protein [Clostridia bacterium]
MVQIKEVKTKGDLRRFADYPNRLYGDVKAFVPPLLSDDLADWDRKKNPAFEYCDAKCWLAYRDGEIVGRIGAILSRKANEKWGTSRMRFTQVDFIDDPEVSEALFATVEEYARACGCDQVHGPLGFTDLDREGLLVEGFDRRNMFITYYNAPYYNDHLTRLGYAKDVDWIEFYITVPEEDAPAIQRVKKVAKYVTRNGKYRVVQVRSRKDYGPYIRKVFNLVNEAYAHLYGTVDLSEKQIVRYADKFIPMVDPEYVCFVEDDRGELVAFGITAPSLADAFKKCRGRLFPFGWMGVLKALKKNDAADLFLIAVRPDLQGKGLNAVILDYLYGLYRKNGIRVIETGPQLETNQKVQSQWDGFDKELHKRRRCYIKDLQPVAQKTEKEPATV